MEEQTKKVEYLFDVGDIVKMKKGESFFIGNKEYHEHLKVVFRFFDGEFPSYVIETEDGVGTPLREYDLDLEEKCCAPVCEQEEQAPIDGRDKKLYLVRNGLGNFHVIAHSFDEAADVLEGRLNQATYGFTSKRQVKSIDIVATQHFFNGKQWFCGEEGHLIIDGDKP
jgi:hypothetical protein